MGEVGMGVMGEVGIRRFAKVEMEMIRKGV